MNTDRTSPRPIPPSEWLSPPKARQRHIPNLGNWLIGTFVLGVLLSALIPVCGCSPQVKGMQTKSLAQAKQIGLALRAFADDHNGDYPRAGLSGMLGAEVKDSNAAFAALFPQYITSESIFGNRLVKGSRVPDNVIDAPYTGKPVRTLEPGENVYAYVSGLTARSDEHAPLVADGTDGTGHYTTDTQKRGGVWAGQKAVVVRLDNSASVMPLQGADHARFLPVHDEKLGDGNLLDVANLGPNARLLDPAVGPR